MTSKHLIKGIFFSLLCLLPFYLLGQANVKSGPDLYLELFKVNPSLRAGDKLKEEIFYFNPYLAAGPINYTFHVDLPKQKELIVRLDFRKNGRPVSVQEVSVGARSMASNSIKVTKYGSARANDYLLSVNSNPPAEETVYISFYYLGNHYMGELNIYWMDGSGSGLSAQSRKNASSDFIQEMVYRQNVSAYSDQRSKNENFSARSLNASPIRTYGAPAVNELSAYQPTLVSPESGLEPFIPVYGFSVQLAALDDPPDLREFKNLDNWRLYVKQVRPHFKVLTGIFADQASAKAALQEVKKLGYPQAFIVEENTRADGYWQEILAPVVYEVQAPAFTERSVRKTHTVTLGETLYSISRKYGVTVEELKALNGLANGKIYDEQVLYLE